MPGTTTSRARSIDAAIDTLTPEYRQCRDYGHIWTPWRAEWLPRRVGIEQWLRCARCNTHRHRVLSPRGEVQSSSYVYPDGYALTDVGRFSHDDRARLRLAVALGTLDGA